ncbi:hypothetical protein TNIN_370361 [Trichonephila inaurata madagascariensis]|uniref:Uncharacterized protein n=1 Tax=Trichonephila inaurata madagascariensis TaxID=2747483 RepID=A0A8X6MM61_9ARAC|nr:hypothetical protein TNIN_300461 [Trichonephila inaurata madagascariensis]GFY76018.1 hypothetical protein TNIN_370361 [Trichonephila inaurata madagascariensis]
MDNNRSDGVFQRNGPIDRKNSLLHNYVVWLYVKSLVYKTVVNTAQNLLACGAATGRGVRDKLGIFDNVLSSVSRRYDACKKASARNVKHLL